MRWALVVALAWGPPRPPRPADPWFGLDKWKHFAASAVVQGVGYGVGSARNDHAASLRIGAGAVTVIGLTREVHDRYRKGHFSVKDLAWDAFGGIAAAVALHAVR